MNIDLSTEIRFRCPHCQKLYCSDSSALSFQGSIKDIAQAMAGAPTIEYNEFECLECHKNFYLLADQNEMGLYHTSKPTNHEFSTCPKCSFLKPHRADECPNCGVLESRYNEVQRLENPRLFELNKAWKVVMQDFTLDQSHQKFLDFAQSHSALNFAAQKYAELKKNMGFDSLVEKYIQQIEVRLESQIQQRFQKESQASKSSESTFLFGLKVSSFFVTIGCTGVALLIFNKIRPTFPNLTGLIVAVTLLSFGLWFLSFRTHEKN